MPSMMQAVWSYDLNYTVLAVCELDPNSDCISFNIQYMKIFKERRRAQHLESNRFGSNPAFIVYQLCALTSYLTSLVLIKFLICALSI